MNPGYVYILTNDAMPGLVKIGRTSRDVDLRASELWQTGVPQRFEVFWSCKTPDCVQLEAYVHGDLRAHRVSKSREFFMVDEFDAQERIRLWAGIQAQEWCSEFFEEMSAIHNSEIAAICGLEDLVSDAGLNNRDRSDRHLVASAISRLTAVEISPALERERSARRAEKLDLFREMGIPEEEWEGLLDE